MKKKILFVMHLPPPIHGAAMVGKFIKESKYISEAFDADYINLTTSFDIKKIGKSGLGKFSALLRIQARLYKALQSKKYDLIYVTLNSHGPGFYKDFLVVLFLKLSRKKLVYHFHNKGVATQQDKPIINLLYKFTFKNTKSILLSKNLYSDVAKYVKHDNVLYCANGIPDVNETTIISDEQKQGTEVCRLLFFSNMYIAKGVYDLLEACKILRQRNIAFECHFVGAWSELTEEIMNLKIRQAGLSHAVFQHGKKTGSEKFRHFQQADVFVSPSHNECFPLVVLEAMQFALPVVSTTVGGIPDMVIDGETGFLITPKDVNALADRLETLIVNPDLRRKMGQAGKALYKNTYTMEIFEKNMTSILQKAMADK